MSAVFVIESALCFIVVSSILSGHSPAFSKLLPGVHWEGTNKDVHSRVMWLLGFAGFQIAPKLCKHTTFKDATEIRPKPVKHVFAIF